MELLFAPESRPFAVAAATLLGLVTVETISLVLGAPLSHLVDKAFDTDGDGLVTLNWLNVGGVPLLVLVMLFLASFSIAGLLIQQAASAVAGPLPALAASAAALAITVPVVRGTSRAVARIIPRDETYAVELADLVGLTADVTVGPLDQGLPGSVRLKDRHGNWHTLRARAAKDAGPLPTGSKVLLVDQSAGVFTAISAPSDLG